MERLKRRQDFVAAAKAAYAATPGMVVQARNRGDTMPARIGFTATKRLGKAVIRNRIKRRLREVARLYLRANARAGFDYVLIGRAPTLDRPFADLHKDLTSALKRLHHSRSPSAGKDAP
ncbi:MAG: ribonuclease P protein component [Alphaproteobacteria bacterium]|nr:ribonuclease P protein component [Alphaproteobacteria bacterium]